MNRTEKKKKKKKKRIEDQNHVTGLPNIHRSCVLHFVSAFECQLSTNQTIYYMFWWIISGLHLQIRAHPSWSVSCYLIQWKYTYVCLPVDDMISYIILLRSPFTMFGIWNFFTSTKSSKKKIKKKVIINKYWNFEVVTQKMRT